MEIVGSTCLRDVIRLTYALADQWMASYAKPPSSVTLDIDDTCDVAHGHQQLSLFNAHYDERCFLPRPPSHEETKP
jgi:DDE family transposase